VPALVPPLLRLPVAPIVPLALLPVPELVFTPLPCISPPDIELGVGVRSAVPLVVPAVPPLTDPVAPPGLEGGPAAPSDPPVPNVWPLVCA
jgi:hypothetical protein